MNEFVIVVHGGAGTVKPGELSPAKEVMVLRGLEEALEAGRRILSDGGNALDAVQAAVRSLEDDPLFNAGRGSVLNFDEKHELEASIMDGKTLKAGAVTGLTTVRNPVCLARAVMDHTDFVFLNGQGAEAFARERNFEPVSNEYFLTRERYGEWLKKRNPDEQAESNPSPSGASFGTVGAVALDVHGNLASATSTGGLTNKKYGRIGDTPLIGSGTYARNGLCAVSCTGDGEYMIRSVAAYDVACLIEYKGLSLEEACRKVIHEKVAGIGGEGGLIAVDKEGNIALPYNSPSMYRGYIIPGKGMRVSIFEEIDKSGS
jgi:beta-aspartyl-peptidase (threonine type)